MKFVQNMLQNDKEICYEIFGKFVTRLVIFVLKFAAKLFEIWLQIVLSRSMNNTKLVIIVRTFHREEATPKMSPLFLEWLHLVNTSHDDFYVLNVSINRIEATQKWGRHFWSGFFTVNSTNDC